MAYLTKLDAVNRILMGIKIKTVAALDTAGFTEAADAERELDYQTKMVQLEGHFGNRIMCKAYTAASTKVVLAADVIAIKAAGTTQHRHFDIRRVGSETRVFDLNRDTTAFTNGEVVNLDVTVEIPFIDCPVYIQNQIVERTVQSFQRFYMGDPLRDQALDQHRVRAEAIAPRASGNTMSDRSNPGAFSLSRPGGNDGGRQ